MNPFCQMFAPSHQPLNRSRLEELETAAFSKSVEGRLSVSLSEIFRTRPYARRSRTFLRRISRAESARRESFRKFGLRDQTMRELSELNAGLWCCERCFNQSKWLPPEAPRFCHSTPGIYRSRICCDKDFCNQNLYPDLLSPDSSKLSSGILLRGLATDESSPCISLCLCRV